MGQTELSVAALAASLLSLVLATAIAIRQANLSHRANQIPVLLDMLYRGRPIAFRKREAELWLELGKYDPNQGLVGLPDGVRDQALEVAYFYQHLAYLVAFRIVDRDIAALPVHNRIRKTWDALGPFIESERRISGDAYVDYLREFQYLAKSIDDDKIRRMNRRIGRHVFGVDCLE